MTIQAPAPGDPLGPELLKAIFLERISLTGTVGKDGITPQAFGKNLDAEVQSLAAKAVSGEYRFTQYKQKLILKGANKPPREISIATVRDRVVLRAITNFLVSVFSDRRIVPAHYIVSEIAEAIQHLDDEYSFVQIDIRDFYPTVNHDLLIEQIGRRVKSDVIIDLVKKAIQTNTGPKGPARNVGIPQGLSISNILSSIYMTRFDDLMQKKGSYYRYVDDIVTICKTKTAKRKLGYITQKLNDIGLTCHEPKANSKTKICKLSVGIDYLGYSIRPGYISVRASSYKRMMDNIMAVISAARHTSNHAKAIARINIRISGCIFDGRRMGWMFFFSMTQDIRQLQRLDDFVLSAWTKAGLDKFGTPKRFVKAYYEIRYRFDRTKYIPKFDEYDIDQKSKLIADILNKSLAEIQTWSVESIERKFLQLVKKEVSKLEQDVTPIS